MRHGLRYLATTAFAALALLACEPLTGLFGGGGDTALFNDACNGAGCFHDHDFDFANYFDRCLEGRCVGMVCASRRPSSPGSATIGIDGIVCRDFEPRGDEDRPCGFELADATVEASPQLLAIVRGDAAPGQFSPDVLRISGAPSGDLTCVLTQAVEAEDVVGAAFHAVQVQRTDAEGACDVEIALAGQVRAVRRGYVPDYCLFEDGYFSVSECFYYGSALKRWEGASARLLLNRISSPCANLNRVDSRDLSISRLLINPPCHDDDGDGWGVDSSPFCRFGSGDCDDSTDSGSGANPALAEVCGDGRDNDCDGAVDESDDADGDGYGICAAQLCSMNCLVDCDESRPDAHPGASERCNGRDDNCDGRVDEGYDFDGDGWTGCAGDCNDEAAYISPEGYEFCDGVDDDCDGVIDQIYDPDGDGWNDCLSTCLDPDEPTQIACYDCDRSNPSVHPGAHEMCNGRDDDCDGRTDEGYTATELRADADMDGYRCGDPYSDSGERIGADCDDADSAVHPGAVEVCDNGKDDNCNVAVDLRDPACAGACRAQPENKRAVDGACANGVDDDCDGLVDFRDPDCVSECIDKDGDGFTEKGGVCGVLDCDDAHADVNPSVEEVIGNERDDNCNGRVDEFDAECADDVVVSVVLEQPPRLKGPGVYEFVYRLMSKQACKVNTVRFWYERDGGAYWAAANVHAPPDESRGFGGSVAQISDPTGSIRYRMLWESADDELAGRSAVRLLIDPDRIYATPGLTDPFVVDNGFPLGLWQGRSDAHLRCVILGQLVDFTVFEGSFSAPFLTFTLGGEGSENCAPGVSCAGDLSVNAPLAGLYGVPARIRTSPDSVLELATAGLFDGWLRSELTMQKISRLLALRVGPYDIGGCKPLARFALAEPLRFERSDDTADVDRAFGKLDVEFVVDDFPAQTCDWPFPLSPAQCRFDSIPVESIP